ncbi:iron-containing alcohol dehydrogenase [Massilia sp. TS11]|uniref:iron-containing alcohol dehydrogenase n=1 Tax=Massilia sp. TS11 TaxID=2908003 RepID=UPI001ED9F6D0|nr:iron-containing alcohol dehydrogenase [Massilia sp. TS11]MCG2585229.1 iron-containing alcohol dehydrogenase [Massilia sp. TS11]
MDSFFFSTVPHLVCAVGAASRLGDHIRAHFPHAQHVMLVTDPGFLATGLIDGPKQGLADAGLRASLFADVVADPPEQVVHDAVAFAREHEVDVVVGIGGGSPMDVAKLVAVLARSHQPLQEMYGIGKVSGTRMPLVLVPTTAGTGSEVTNIAIVTTGATSKMGVVATQLYADLAILDAGLTYGLPPAVTAATGIDAMVHAIEAYTTRHKKNLLSDMLACKALSLLYPNLLLACEHGDDAGARQAMLLGAMLAGQAFANAPCAAVHALAYPIGGIFHVPHGLSNSLVLPHVLRFNLPAAVTQYAELASLLIPGLAGSEEARADALIQAMAQLPVACGIPTRLQQVGVEDSDLDQLADEAMKQTRLLGNNPRELGWQDARAIYAAAL